MTGALPPRPEPPRRWTDTVQAWWAWIGPTRLLLSAVSVLIVLAGVAWLVRTPPAPTESVLPVAGSVAPDVTLAPPSTAIPADAAVTTPPTTVPTEVFVHVAGAVMSPGVYRLITGDRVHAAIDAAGGPSATAELDGLNLAAPVADGQRIYVPIEGEVDPSAVPSEPPAPVVGVDGPDDDGANTVVAGPIDLNTATAEQLDTLPGIGPATATAIVDDRDRHGPFATVDDLQRVPGIGPAKLAAVADLVTV